MGGAVAETKPRLSFAHGVCETTAAGHHDERAARPRDHFQDGQQNFGAPSDAAANLQYDA